MKFEFPPPDPRLEDKVKIIKLNAGARHFHSGTGDFWCECAAGPTNDARAKDRLQSGRELISRVASEIPPEKIEWLWIGRIARGKHTTVAGDPGTGKSQVMISMISVVTTGAEWPCGEGKAPIGSVIILAAEDSAADTLVPRLMAAGADLKKIHIIEAVRDGSGMRMFNLQADLDALESKIAAVGDVVLICIDPISSYLGKVDSHKNAELRSVLEPVGRMADRSRVAVLSVTHFSKQGGGAATKALYRFIGSVAFTAAPRAAFVVVEDADDKGRRLFLHGKNNLARPAQGLAFRLAQKIVDEERKILGSYVVWEEQAVETTADEAVSGRKHEATATDDAVDFLRDLLAGGEVAVASVEESARAAGFLKPGQPIGQSKPFRSARSVLGIKPYQAKGGKSGGWFWALPEHQMPSESSDALVNERAPDGVEGT